MSERFNEEKGDAAQFTAKEREELRRLVKQNRWKWRAIAVVWLLFAAFVVYAYVQNRDRSQEGQKAHDVLCAQHDERLATVRRTQKLLTDNPKGKLIDVDPDPTNRLMVARSTLKNNLAIQQALIATVERVGIDCPKQTKTRR